MRNKYYIVNVPPWGKVYYTVNLPGVNLLYMGECLLYDNGIEEKVRLETIVRAHTRMRLILIYKIVNDLIAIPAETHITPNRGNTRSSTTNKLKLQLQFRHL